MDSLIAQAARALAAGDALGALNLVALRDDAPALALRGIAVAQLGDLTLASQLLRKAIRLFGSGHPLAQARCIVAQAEIALVSRDLAWSAKVLHSAQAVLDAHGDRLNAAHARHLEARRLLLSGRLDEAEKIVAALDPDTLSPASRTIHHLITAGISMRRLRIKAAHAALIRARQAALRSQIPGLMAEAEHALHALKRPAARLLAHNQNRPLRLEEIEELSATPTLIVDACRNTVSIGEMVIPLATRPVLFSLARLLAQAWPADASRETLIAGAFRTMLPDETHRARLRVEIGRLRKALHPLTGILATQQGFVLVPHGPDNVVVLASLVEDRHAAVLALLADGESWSSSALALALGASQRTVQRALDALACSNKVQSFGRGRARRWLVPPLPDLTTTLLLPAPPVATFEAKP
ncbi:MAG: helix-turn-helix domain-containing protein [Burkholderiaceae bacterium]|nr:MAG: helix-turn-helix domain-containing protein [Burkholderiaceae bacterium]TAM11107.1 MAG: helix-turn-helix domain-containing protein [Pusillimonas sp.]